MRGIRLVVCVVAVLSWSSVFAADKPSQGLGQLVVKDAQADSPVRLNVAAYHAHVVLQPPVALVQIDQSFYNPYPSQQEGTFVFSLPEGASVSRFAMYVSPGNLVEGELIERGRARQVYQTIVDRRRDPAILEQIGDNLFKMRVFPIPAKGVKRILLDYTVPLEADGEGSAFRLPLFSDLEPIWDFRLSGVIRAAVRPGGVESPTHPEIEFKQSDDGSVGFELIKKNHRPTADLMISFTEEKTPKVSLRNFVANSFFIKPKDNARADKKVPGVDSTLYFQLSIPYAAGNDEKSKDSAVEAPSPADVLVLADTSSSMRNNRLLKETVGDILRKLRPEDRFRLACVDLSVRPLGEQWLVGGSDNVADALKKYDDEFFLGGTDLAASFARAVKLFDEKSDRRRLIVYVGDGRQSGKTVDFDSLKKNMVGILADARVSLVGVLVRHNMLGRGFMNSLTRASGGLMFDLSGSTLARRDLGAWLSTGMAHPEKIERISIEGCAADDLYYPSAWLPGRTLHLFGRMDYRDTLKAKITTFRDGKKIERQWTLNVDERRNDVFVGRLWAQRRLDQARGDMPPGTDPQVYFPADVKKGMIELSQEWSLLTPLTAFLVLESEADYKRWKIDRRNRHRYWNPPDAKPPAELPEDWISRAREQVGQADVADGKQRFSIVLRSAREAIEGGNPSLADRLLRSVGDLPETDRKEYDELSRLASEGIRREGLLKLLGTYRDKLDPASVADCPRQRPDLLTRLAGATNVNREFLERHPYAKQLLKETPVRLEARKYRSVLERLDSTDGGDKKKDESSDMALTDLVLLLQRDSNMNVVVDLRALDDIGLKYDTQLRGYGRGRMSLRAYARFLLGQIDLVMVEQPHRLWITTPEQAECTLATEVYPIPDLLMADRMATKEQLADPYLDRRLSAERRIREKLKRPVNVKFVDTPLNEVVDHFAKELNDTVLIDEKALSDVGIGVDVPVTAAWRDVPVKDSLRWMLRNFGLTYTVGDEALLITTPEEAECRLKLKLHSGCGVVFEYAVPRQPDFYGVGGGMAGGMFGASGGMGGMGGMAMGGMGFFGGSGGMGMGGFSGGGTFGGGGNEQPPTADDTSSPISSGGDATVPSQPDGQDSADDDGADKADDYSRFIGFPAPGNKNAPSVQYVCDVDSISDIVTSTVRPHTWEEVGGPGTVSFVDPTLDFVISTTDDVHEQIDMLFERLRKLPPMDRGDGVWRPAEPRSDRFSDFDSLIDMITSTVLPTTWDDVGGPGTIAPYETRGALVVSQTREVHDKISELLTQLRRSRHESLHDHRPWLWTVPSPERPLISPWPKSVEPAPRMSELPQANAEELAVLTGLREEKAGVYRWRRTAANGKESEEITLLCGGGRVELRLSDCTLIADGDQAKIVWPGLKLIELGNWGEDIRRFVDKLLPWMPHRSNEELARMFQVAKTDSGRVRLVPNGLPKDADSFLEAEFSGDSPLPRFWRSQLAGRPTGRLRTGTADGRPAVTFSGGNGKVVARWELMDSNDPPALPLYSLETTVVSNNYVCLDRRSPEAMVDRLLAEAVGAMAKSDWDEATAKLRKMLAAYPRHPLLLLLTAWCHENNPGFCSRELMIDALKQLARQGAGSLSRHINDRFFPSLTPSERYEILVGQPTESIEAEDWDRLAALAAEIDRTTDAIAHARAALRFDRGERRFERQCLMIESLLRLQRSEEADDLAIFIAANAAPEQTAILAELLAQYGRVKLADELFAHVLEKKGLTPNERYGFLCRRAAIHRGQPRWRLLLEAAETAKKDSLGRSRALKLIIAELVEPIQAEIAGQLAAAAKSQDVKFRMLLAQADLSVALEDRSELFWEVHQSGRLPRDRYETAFIAWNAENHPERVIEIAEKILRQGKRLKNDRQMQELSSAYRKAGRELDARRAAFDDPPPKPARSRNSGIRRPVGGRGFF